MTSASPHFLRHLVERSLEAPLGLQPRLPSVFEPMPWDAPTPDSDVEVSVPAAIPRTAAAPSETTSGNPMPTFERTRQGAPLPGPPIVSAPATSPTVSNDPAPDRDTHQIAVEQVSRRMKVRLEAMPDAALAARPIHLGAIERPAHGELPPEPQRAARPEHRRSERLVGGLELAPLRHTQTQLLTSAAPQVISSIAAPREPARVVAPDPVVNVTIGRLEIRTQQNPKPAPRPTATAAQPMSLHEYLQQRGGMR